MGVLLQSACLILSLLYYEDQSGTIFENFSFRDFQVILCTCLRIYKMNTQMFW